MSTPENVFFKSQGLKIAAHFYRPVQGSPDREGAAVVIAHPWTSIKEQSPANYARVLTQAGFYCICPDSAYRGSRRASRATSKTPISESRTSRTP